MYLDPAMKTKKITTTASYPVPKIVKKRTNQKRENPMRATKTRKIHQLKSQLQTPHQVKRTLLRSTKKTEMNQQWPCPK